MLSTPGSPCGDSNRQHDYGDNGERSKVHAALSTLVQAFLANNVRTPSAIWIATTCDELRPLALSADAASGDESISSRSDCISFLLVCLTISSTLALTAGCNFLMSTTCMLSLTVLD